MSQKNIKFSVFIILICFFGLLLSDKVQAEVKLAKIFADSMVIQRDQPFNVWGMATPEENVTVHFRGRDYRTQASKLGRWQVQLPAQQAGTGQSLQVDGDTTTVINDIAFGDLFLAGGQSNMEFKLERVLSMFPQENKLQHYPDIRHFKVQRHYDYTGPQQEIKNGKWLTANAQNVTDFSAVAWFFAKALSQHYDVPIGIISSSVGATPINSWMSLSSLEKQPNAYTLATNLANSEFRNALQTQYAQIRKQWRQQNPSKKKMPFRLKHETSMDFKPTGFYNAMIAPLSPIRFAGVIWYQGENNTRAPATYSTQFTNLIQRWRQLFKQPQLPFMFVQLANFQKPDKQPAESNWAELRAQQTLVLNTVNNTAMALAIDVGEAFDIHPKDKQTVGQRLALGARHLVYGDNKVIYTSPMVETAKLVNNKVVVQFNNTGSGLMVKGAKLNGFALAGEDGRFVWADAQLKDNQVVVSATKIKSAKYLRYAWGNNPVNANLYSNEGLPTTPFEISLN